MATPRDAVTVAPHVYRVLLENDRVRVLEVRGTPGATTQMHSHPASVAIAVTDGTYRFTSPDGRTTDAELKAGQAMYFDAVEHAGEFTGTTETRVVLVELK
jgi:quercetin dioxygenase-like cupin family protein